MNKELFNEAQKDLDAAEVYADSVDKSGLSESALKVADMCLLYGQIRPVIKFARGLLFFWHRGQLVIDKFILSMDETCKID